MSDARDCFMCITDYIPEQTIATSSNGFTSPTSTNDEYQVCIWIGFPPSFNPRIRFLPSIAIGTPPPHTFKDLFEALYNLPSSDAFSIFLSSTISGHEALFTVASGTVPVDTKHEDHQSPMVSGYVEHFTLEEAINSNKRVRLAHSSHPSVQELLRVSGTGSVDDLALYILFVNPISGHFIEPNTLTEDRSLEVKVKVEDQDRVVRSLPLLV